MEKKVILKTIINIKYSLIFCLFIYSQNIYAQELDKDFLNSLPDDIRNDVLENVSNANSEGDVKSSKTYNSFDSRSKISDHELHSNEQELRKFGDRFFLNKPSTFMPINDPAANSGYILDVDDEVLISLMGSRTDSYNYKIDRSGNIIIKDLGMINLAGLSIESANKLLNNELKNSFVDTEAVITLSKVRDIEVLITGQIKQPGIYILSGYSNLLHAIVMAGGASEYGSLRNIKIKRNSYETRSIDLYELLVFGNTGSNLSLRSGDSIFIESTQNFVPIIGGVAQPAIYEFKDGESIQDLVRFAGGIIKESSEQPILVSRKKNDSYKSFESDLEDLLNKGDRVFVPFNKYKEDIFLIDDESQFLHQPVKISGAVKKPGEYYLSPSNTLSDLIDIAGGFKEEAYIFGSVLINKDSKTKEALYNQRLYDEAIKSLISLSQAASKVDISKILPILTEFKNTAPSGRVVTEFDNFILKNHPELDIKLTSGDEIYIPYKLNIVHVFGEVLNSGSVTYNSNMSVKDYIESAGGLNDSADKQRVILVQANGIASKVNLRGSLFGQAADEVLPGAVIYVSRDMRDIEGLDLAMAISPIVSSLAISLASINSINRN